MKISLWKSIRNIVALGVIGLGANVQASEMMRLPSPEIGYELNQETLLVRGQSEAYFASYDSAGTFGHTTAGGGAGCDTGCNNGCNDCCDCECIGNWWDNTTLFYAGDAWKGFGDTIFNNSFGNRGGANIGFAIGDSNIRGQIGGSVGLYDYKGRLIGDNDEIETQLFGTAGVYKRSDICNCDAWAWGVVVDVVDDNNYGAAGDEFNLAQGRYLVGYATSEANEFGVWGTFQVDDTAVQLFPGIGRTAIRNVNQANAFWHHNYAFGGDTYAYIGVADGVSDFTWGVTGNAPLSDSLAVFGGFNYYSPSAAIGTAGSIQDLWNVSFGIAWYPGCKAANSTVSGWKGMPLLGVADNGTFQITP